MKSNKTPPKRNQFREFEFVIRHLMEKSLPTQHINELLEEDEND